MQRTLRTARRARARLTARDVVQRAGRWMLLGAGASAVLVAAEKVVGLPGPWWAWVGAPVVAAGAAAAVVELLKRRELLESAALVDEQLGLKDRLGSALALASDARQDPFVALALDESEAVAPTADPARAVPIRFGNSWWTWPVVVAASIAGALWLPESSILKAKEMRRVAQAEAVRERERTAAEIGEAVREAERTAAGEAGDAAADALAARRLEALRRLEEELRGGAIDAEEAREESARTLEETAAELGERSAEAQRLADATRDRMAQRVAPAADDESPLSRAVREGDMAAAREAARELMEKTDELTPEERAKVAEDLRRLAEELKEREASGAAAPGAGEGTDEVEAGPDGAAPKGEEGAHPAGPMEPSLREDLKEQGLSEDQAGEVGESRSEEEARKKLEELGLPPEAAQKMAKRVTEDAARRRAEEAARDKTEELSRSLKDAADQLDKGDSRAGENRDAGLENQGARDNAGRTEPSERRETAPQQPGAEQGSKPKAEPAAKPGESGRQEQRPGAERTNEAPGRTTPQGDQKRREGDGKPAPGETPEAAGEKRPAGQGKPGEESKGEAKGEQQPTGGDKPAAEPREQPGAETAPAPADEQRPGKGEKEGQSAKEPRAAPRGAGAPKEEGGAGEKAPSEERGERPGEQPGAMEEPAAKPGAGEQRPGAGEAPKDGMREKTPNLDDLPSPDSPEGKALKRVIEKLREMEQPKQDAAQDRRMSQEMRERARRMMENATPDQKRKLEQWARELAKEEGGRRGTEPRPGEPGQGDEGQESPERDIAGDGPRKGGAGVGDEPGTARRESRPGEGGFKTDVVDARPKDAGAPTTDGRVIGEMEGDGKPGAPMLSKAEAMEAIRRARESAQRAIDDRTIPGRYDRLLRRYFRRLPEKVESEGAPRD